MLEDMVSTPRRQHSYSLGLENHDQVNRAFGGGLPAGSLVMLEGRHGAGKSTLAGRFAYGLCDQSHTVTYLSTERGVSRFLSQMRLLSFDIQKHLLRRKFIYLFGELSGDQMDANPELLARLQGAQRLWQSDVVIIDTFSDILLYDPTIEAAAADNGSQRIIQRLISFFRKLMRTGTTIMLLVSPSGLAERTLEPLRAVSDVLLDITSDSRGSRRSRTINVHRFAGIGTHVADRIDFSIKPNTGIVIENRTVVQR